MRLIVTLLSAVCTIVVPLRAQERAAAVELIARNGTVRSVTAAELAGMSRREVQATSHQVTGTFAGVPISELLALVGAPRGDSLRGPALATYVQVEAADGYRVVFALAELDSGFTDRVVLLADRKDGAPLTARDGPFQLVVPGEKRPARWVRQVRRIRVVTPPAATP